MNSPLAYDPKKWQGTKQMSFSRSLFMYFNFLVWYTLRPVKSNIMVLKTNFRKESILAALTNVLIYRTTTNYTLSQDGKIIETLGLYTE
jgi:hypothetical protein